MLLCYSMLCARISAPNSGPVVREFRAAGFVENKEGGRANSAESRRQSEAKECRGIIHVDIRTEAFYSTT